MEVQDLDILPKPTGGMEGWYNYLAQNLKVPSKDKSGTVIVSFLILEDGSVSDLELLKGISKSCDQVALEVIKSSPRWEPGEKDGKKVTSRMRIPVRFKYN